MAAMLRRVAAVFELKAMLPLFLIVVVLSAVNARAPGDRPIDKDPDQAKTVLKSKIMPQNAVKKIMLSKQPECKEDIENVCGKDVNLNHNFDVLDCLQNDPDADISESCQHLIWVYKRNLTKDDRFEAASKGVCSEDFKQITECDALATGSGQRIPCMIENLDNVTNKDCQRFLGKMAKIVFSDYRMVYHFMEHCTEDIHKLGCGRLDTGEEEVEKLHDQGKTIVCLAGKIRKVNEECKKQVLRVAELQADDYHLDRPLFYACREVREKICTDVPAGGGKVYECLYKKKDHRLMSSECRDKLTVRQSLIAEDVKVEKTFFTACLKDIRANGCMKGGTTDSGGANRFHILMCLENAMAQDVRLDGACIEETRQLRQELMSDYQISPEIVVNCDQEIKQHCDGGLQHGGKTLHCLFELANPNPGQPGKVEWKVKIGHACKGALEDLMLEANVAQDMRIDRVLSEACQEVIEQDCSQAAQDGKGIQCLMQKVDSDHMTDECEDRLLEIQYFIVRDFRLEPELYKACRKDATELCGADDSWYDVNKPTVENDPNLVMSCLYRHMDVRDEEAEGKQLSNKCHHQVRKTMKKRAKRVDLEPEIEMQCLRDLGLHCSDLEHYGKGKELYCLQDHLEELDDDCQKAVEDFTVQEGKEPDIDAILMNACTPMIKRFCEDILDTNDADKVMECLIDHKHHKDMDEKCAAGVEHHQIIQMKDIKFSPKFKEACKGDVMQFCRQKTKKSDIVVCLSEIIREDVLKGGKPRLTPQCHSQLRVEVLQRSETINLDKELVAMCKKDIEKRCSGVKAGNAEMIECLRSHKQDLEKGCHGLLFKREQDEAVLGADYLLFKTCKLEIKKFCRNEMTKGQTGVLNCLKRHKDEAVFDPHCRKVVMRRALEESKDFRLNPSLMKSCHMDIPKFCSEELSHRKDDEELEGKVINCLKKQLIKKRLSRECMMEIKLIIRETHLDIDMDPVLMHACQAEIKQYCRQYVEDHEAAVADGGNGNLRFIPNETGDKVEECLQQKLFEGKINQKTPCAKEITRVVEEISIDVNIDPLLYNACTEDLTHWCREIESGEGRKMSCLLSVLEDSPQSLKPKCQDFLVKRKTLWEYAAKGAPAESLSDLHQQVMNSPARSYLLGVLMTVVGIIFIVGITCGRVTKRVSAAQKNK